MTCNHRREYVLTTYVDSDLHDGDTVAEAVCDPDGCGFVMHWPDGLPDVHPDYYDIDWEMHEVFVHPVCMTCGGSGTVPAPDLGPGATGGCGDCADDDALTARSRRLSVQ